MLQQPPDNTELLTLLGADAYDAWQSLCTYIHENYIMDAQWDIGRKENIYEYKFRRSGKTLCALYVREQSFGFLMIFGKNEREKFETNKAAFSQAIQAAYEKEPIYHDGKWVLFLCTDSSPLNDYEKMLQIKKKPNKKAAE